MSSSRILSFYCAFAEGPFTLFAPTDEAFDRIPQETLSRILSDTDALRPILQRHVIPSKALFSKGISWDEYQTAGDDGDQMIATQVFKNGVIKVASSLEASAFITQKDLIATNGVIHVLDTVI